MPDHRPHAPYVGVPKWERRSVVFFSGVCLRTDKRNAEIRFLFYSWQIGIFDTLKISSGTLCAKTYKTCIISFQLLGCLHNINYRIDIIQNILQNDRCKVLLKIVGQLASSVEYKPRLYKNSKQNLGEDGYFYDYNIRAKCLLHIFCYCSFMWSIL